jgi:hypothetical protein
MKFHALLPVRDEGDIIEQSLRQLLRWADAIYVFDTGSVDATWDLVQEVASEDRRVIPLMQAPVYFSDKRVRAWIFHQARSRMREGDWFLRVDADEFHHVPPPEFVMTKMRPHETVAFHQYYDFRLTASEAADWETGRVTPVDRFRPIAERRRWYTVNGHTEPRLCRYRSSMQWPDTVSFPFNAGYRAEQRLPIRHYPHRDPLQLQRRCALRVQMMAESDNACVTHWSQANWREHVVADDHPDLRYWTAGVDLPAFPFINHLAPLPVRALQRVAHAALLPLLDSCRAGFAVTGFPRPLPAELNEPPAVVKATDVRLRGDR